MTEYQTPEIFQDSDEDSIHDRMLSVLPENIDKSEGSVVWDLTRPTALEVAQFKGWDMDYAIQMIFPQFASGEILDYHGEARGLSRKDAIAASGKLTVTGEAGATIAVGDLFATESVNNQESVSYRSVGYYIIPESGTIEIDVECTEAGAVGNAIPNTIILVETANERIESVTNATEIKGGVDEESDDEYRERIVESDKNKDASYAGTPADYKRWANEVSGVGSVTVIPAQDTSGTVTLIITDGNGDPANTTLCNAVYKHIMSPSDEDQRLAPINAVLVVQPPSSVAISITANVELSVSNIETVTAAFREELRKYLHSSIDDGEIRYTKISNILGDTTGVYDYTNLLINGSTGNIELTSEQLPTVGTITLTAV